MSLSNYNGIFRRKFKCLLSYLARMYEILQGDLLVYIKNIMKICTAIYLKKSVQMQYRATVKHFDLKRFLDNVM